MILVGRIVIRSEDRSKTLAGTAMHRAQEDAFLPIAAPPVFDGNTPTVFQHKGADIKRFGTRMSGSARATCDVATGITAHRLDPREGRAKDLPGRPVDPVSGPSGESIRRGTRQRAKPGNGELARVAAKTVKPDSVERRASAAIIPIGQGSKTRATRAKLGQTLLAKRRGYPRGVPFARGGGALSLGPSRQGGTRRQCEERKDGEHETKGVARHSDGPCRNCTVVNSNLHGRMI